MHHRTYSMLQLALLSICASSAATAQAVSEPGQLEEVMVSATRRVESITSVPVSVAAVSGDAIRDGAVTNLTDLLPVIPNVQFTGSTILPNIYVRGVGSGSTHSVEQSAGTFIDDVYIGRGVMNTHGYFDLASAEFLRGPQGTLFGKNTAAGAIILRTASPTETPEFGVDLTGGRYSTTGGYGEAQAFASGPLSDALRGRIALRYRDESGFLENQLPGPNGADRRDYGVRVKLDWRASDATQVKFKAEYARYTVEGDNATETIGDITNFRRFLPAGFVSKLDWKIFLNCQVAPRVSRDTSLPQDGIPDVVTQTSPFCPGREQYTWNTSVNVSHEMLGGTLTSITAYQRYHYDQRFVALDGGSTGGKARFYRSESYDGLTQEFRFVSGAIGRSDYIVGAYFEDSSIDRQQPSDFNQVDWTAPIDIFLRRDEPWRQDTRTAAAYGQWRWGFAEKFRAIVGLRYSYEEKKFRFRRWFSTYGDSSTPIPTSDAANRAVSNGGALGAVLSTSASRSEDKVTPSLTLQWTPSSTTSLYASYAEGHKTGGFSDRLDNLNQRYQFDPEELKSYELGAKGKWLGGRLNASLAVFYMDVKDMQVAAATPNLFNIPQFTIANAGVATSKGAEFEGAWRVAEWLTVGGNVAYTKARFDDFPGAQYPPGKAPVTPGGQCNLKGFPLIYAPEWKGAAYVEVHPGAIAGWDVTARGEMTHSDRYFTDILYDPRLSQGAYQTYSASIRATSPGEMYSIALLVKNIGNTIAQEWASPSIPFFAEPNKPRQYVLKLTAKF